VLGSVKVAGRVSTELGWPQKIRTVQGGLESANHAVGLLSGVVGGRGGLVDVAGLKVLDDLSRVLFRLVRGVGVGDIGLWNVENQST
jgi:hypothetical protein